MNNQVTMTVKTNSKEALNELLKRSHQLVDVDGETTRFEIISCRRQYLIFGPYIVVGQFNGLSDRAMDFLTQTAIEVFKS